MAMVSYRLKRINKIKRINFFILSINMNQKKNNATFILISFRIKKGVSFKPKKTKDYSTKLEFF
jgi:hypothetical protein